MIAGLVIAQSLQAAASRTEVRAPDAGAASDEAGGGVLPPLAIFVATIALVAAIRALRVASASARPEISE